MRIPKTTWVRDPGLGIIKQENYLNYGRSGGPTPAVVSDLYACIAWCAHHIHTHKYVHTHTRQSQEYWCLLVTSALGLEMKTTDPWGLVANQTSPLGKLAANGNPVSNNNVDDIWGITFKTSSDLYVRAHTSTNPQTRSQEWRHTSGISALERLGQEDWEFEASLGCTAGTCLNKRATKKQSCSYNSITCRLCLV